MEICLTTDENSGKPQLRRLRSKEVISKTDFFQEMKKNQANEASLYSKVKVFKWLMVYSRDAVRINH